MSRKFCNIFVRASLWWIYHVIDAIQAMQVPAMAGSIMIVGALSRYTLLHFRYDLKATLTLYEFEQSPNATGTNKNI